MEELTIDICKEYQKRGKELPKDNPLFTDKRKDLVLELKQRCGIPEIWAFNIVNGYHVKDYLAIIEYGKQDQNSKKDNKNDKAYLEWLAEKRGKGAT